MRSLTRWVEAASRIAHTLGTTLQGADANLRSLPEIADVHGIINHIHVEHVVVSALSDLEKLAARTTP